MATKGQGKRSKIIIAAGDAVLARGLVKLLSMHNRGVTHVQTGKSALNLVSNRVFHLVLCDDALGDLRGVEVLRSVKRKLPEMPVIVLSRSAGAETAVEAMNAGAYDYVLLPYDDEELTASVEKALVQCGGTERESVEGKLHFGRIVGDSPRMRHIHGIMRQVARTRSNVLISGESGTGKELIARSIHGESDRREQPFVVINCGGIPENLMESELFGHEKGAFTGAVSDRKGLFELAHGGTVFLDEIGELSRVLQVKLLRAVQERSFKAVGGTGDIEVDIRIISATNKNLEEEVIEGRFREDLFYRLNVIEIKVPPLRERKNDLGILAQYFLDKYCREMGREPARISSYAVDLLKKYDFPGNIRELENLIERSTALTDTNIIMPDSLAISIHKRRWVEGVKGRRFDLDEVEKGVDIDEILGEIERGYLRKAMEFREGNVARASELLGISLRSMRYRLSKLGIDRGGGSD